MYKLTITKSKNNTYYYAQYGVREGKKVSSHTARKFGSHAELLKITDDPEAYVRAEIDKMNQEYDNEHIKENVSIDYGERVKKTADSIVPPSTIMNTGYFFLQAIMKRLNLKKITNEKIMNGSRAKYDAYTILRYLLYSRIIDPRSKLDLCEHLQNFFERPDIQYQDLIRFLDRLSDYFDDIIEALYDSSKEIVKRDQSVCYYDCTNFYFECEQADAEYIDELTGEIIKGLRKYGVSKEHRPNPIVEMGLFIDGDGLPITMCIESGNTSEQKTAIPLERQLVKMYENKPFIYCADAGIGSYDIRRFNSFSKRAFIITQSIKKLSQKMQDVIFTDSDYRDLSNNRKISVEMLKTYDRSNPANDKLNNVRAYKVFPADHSIELNGFTDIRYRKDGTPYAVKAKGVVRQCLIVTFSRKVFEYQRHIRNGQIERAKELLAAAKDPEEVKNSPNDIRRFIKRTGKKDTKSIAELYEINQDRIDKEAMYDGYYCIATNLAVLDKNDEPDFEEVQNVLRVMSKRNKVEEDFRIMKTNFKSRPVYHYKDRRIKAHFLLCFIALLIYRIIEKMLDEQGKHYTVSQIIETIQNVNVGPFKGSSVYNALYDGGDLLVLLCQITNVDLSYRYYRTSTLNKIIKKLTN